MHQLIPKNKHAWIETLDENNKVGTIIIVTNTSSQYRLAKIKALDTECPEAKGFEVGQIVLYDTIGEVSHRIGSQMMKTVRIMNFLGIIASEPVTKFKDIVELVHEGES